MSKTDIIKELENIINDFDELVRLHCTDNHLEADTTDFKLDNFLLTFPFNFNAQPDDLIKSLAVVNYCYGTYFFNEDKIVDDYNVSSKEFQQFIIDMLNSHSLRNLAFSRLLKLCGEEIFQYLFKYEKIYYQALIFEKTIDETSYTKMLERNNLIYLGQKLMPLCSTYAAYCIVQNKRENIVICEDIVVNYHIAKQLADDLEDIAPDLQKPDLSYLLKICQKINNRKACTRDEIIDLLIKESILEQYLNIVIECLSIAEEKAKILKFNYFLEEILTLKRKMEHLIKKITCEVS